MRSEPSPSSSRSIGAAPSLLVQLMGLALATIFIVSSSACSAGSTESRAPSALAFDHTAYRELDPPSVAIIRPGHQESVRRTFEVSISTENYDLTPAGVVRYDEGHWVILVDQPCAAPGDLLGDDHSLIHVDGGSDSTEITLAPGPHQLCVQLADGFSVAVNVVDRIEVFVS